MIHKATPERLSAFSDGVFAVLITVLVLELRPPERDAKTGVDPKRTSSCTLARSVWPIVLIPSPGNPLIA